MWVNSNYKLFWCIIAYNFLDSLFSFFLKVYLPSMQPLLCVEPIVVAFVCASTHYPITPRSFVLLYPVS